MIRAARSVRAGLPEAPLSDVPGFRPSTKAGPVTAMLIGVFLFLGFTLSPFSARAGTLSGGEASVPDALAGGTVPRALTFEQAWNEALRANPAIQARDLELGAARARRLQVDGFASPRLFYDFEEARDLPVSRFGSQKIGIEQAFEWPGRRSSFKQAADLGIDVAQAALERTRLRLMAQLHKTFDQVLLTGEIVRLLKETSERMREAVELSRTRFKTGTDKYLDVLRTQVARQRLENQLREAETVATEARRRFNTLLGRDDTAFTATGTLDPVLPLPSDSGTLLARAQQTGPSFRLAERRIAQAEKQLEAVRKGRYPDLAFAIAQQRLFESAGEADEAWAGTLSLRLPLPGSDRQRGLEAEALAHTRTFAERARAETIQFRARLLQRYDEAHSLEAQLQSYRNAVLPDTEDQLKAAQQEYRVRRIDALNLLDVYTTYRETRQSYLDTLVRYRAALADLETLGEDLREVDE